MQNQEATRNVHIQAGEVLIKISYQDAVCTVESTVKHSFIERECSGLSDKQIAVAVLQLVIQSNGIFVAGNPNLKFTPIELNSDWKFTATFPVLLKPTLNCDQIVEELKNSLSEEDLESTETCKKRLLAIIESRINYPLPKEFLSSTDNPVQAISVWKESIAKGALADMSYPGVDKNLSINDRTDRAVDWVLRNTVITT
jgi:hypothetical protein